MRSLRLHLARIGGREVPVNREFKESTTAMDSGFREPDNPLFSKERRIAKKEESAGVVEIEIADGADHIRGIEGSLETAHGRNFAV